MPAGHGLRARTRDKFSRAFRGKGYIPLSVYLRTYKIGDYVDIKVNSAVQKVSSLCWLTRWRSMLSRLPIRTYAVNCCISKNLAGGGLHANT